MSEDLNRHAMNMLYELHDIEKEVAFLAVSGEDQWRGAIKPQNSHEMWIIANTFHSWGDLRKYATSVLKRSLAMLEQKTLTPTLPED